MPLYQYHNRYDGTLVELCRPVAERDKVPDHLERVTVPARIGIVGSVIDPMCADASVPKAFKDLEQTMGADQILRHSGFTTEQVKKIWNM